MTHIISAFPCLGKTTIYQLNKDVIFDREFNESRSQLGMSDEEREKFTTCCAQIINLQINAQYHDYIFVTDEQSIVSKIEIDNINNLITYIFPNIFDDDDMEGYRRRVINRSGEAWYKRVILPRLEIIPDLIKRYQEQGVDIRFTTENNPYIEDVFVFNDSIKLPNKSKFKVK